MIIYMEIEIFMESCFVGFSRGRFLGKVVGYNGYWEGKLGFY